MKKIGILLFLLGTLAACNLSKDDLSPDDGNLADEWILSKAVIKLTPKAGQAQEYTYGRADHVTKLSSDGKITGIPIFFAGELMIMLDEPSANYTYKTDGNLLSVGVVAGGYDVDKMVFKYSVSGKSMVWETDISLIRSALEDTGGSGLLMDLDEEDLEDYKAVDIRYEFERK